MVARDERGARSGLAAWLAVLDYRAAFITVGVHVVVAVSMILLPPAESDARTLVEFELLAKEESEEVLDEPPELDPDLIEEPEPEPEPEPRRKAKPKPAAPLAEPEAPPPEPEPEPVYFGMLPGSTEGTGSVVVPYGGSLAADPSVTTDDLSKIKKPTAKGPTGPAGTGDAAEPELGKPVSFAMVSKPPRVKKEVRAKYPEEAKELGIEGIVVLRVSVGADGKVKKVKVLDGPGYGLNKAAAAALESFLFVPAKLGGKPVATVIPRYEYEFILD